MHRYKACAGLLHQMQAACVQVHTFLLGLFGRSACSCMVVLQY